MIERLKDKRVWAGVGLVLAGLFGGQQLNLGASTASAEFSVTNQFLGYVNKPDITNIAPNYLVVGSQNVISTDGNTVALRGGYTIDGATSTDESPIRSSYDWLRHTWDQRHIKFSSSPS